MDFLHSWAVVLGQGWVKRRDESFQAWGGRAPGYRLSPEYFQTVKRMLVSDKAKRKCFVLLCPIGEQFLQSSFREFVHDRYYLATVVRFVHQAFLTRNEGTTDESKNVSDAYQQEQLNLH